MTIAEKILRAKADYDAVYEAGKAAGGGGAEPVEMVIEPDYIDANYRFSYETYDRVEDENCDIYEYHIYDMFGATVKVKTALPDDSLNITNDYEHDLSYDFFENEFEAPITTNDGFELFISCVRADGPPQVVVSFKGIVVEPEVSHTACFDGSISGDYIDNEITSVRYGAFAGCTEITKIDLPNCTNVGGNYAFYNMTNVKEILLPNVASGSFGAAFYYCSNVETIDLRRLGGVLFDSNCFRFCSALKTLILGGTAINTIANTNVLGGTPASMSIYVPDNLVDAYKTNSTWASFTSRIKKWSDYPGGGLV